MLTAVPHLNTVAPMRTVQEQFSTMSLSSVAVVQMDYSPLALSSASEQMKGQVWCSIIQLCRSGK